MLNWEEFDTLAYNDGGLQGHFYEFHQAYTLRHKVETEVSLHPIINIKQIFTSTLIYFGYIWCVKGHHWSVIFTAVCHGEKNITFGKWCKTPKPFPSATYEFVQWFQKWAELLSWGMQEALKKSGGNNQMTKRWQWILTKNPK